MQPVKFSAAASDVGQHAKEEMTTLTDLLKKGTRDKHEETENTAFAKKLSKGDLSRIEYGNYLAALHAIYSALETEIRNWQHIALIEPFVQKDFCWMFRTEALIQDMTHFDVSGKGVQKEAVEYVKHLVQIVTEKPYLLVAHIYVRYLGDLFGGQMVKKKFEEKWPDGVAFYDYGKDHDKPTRFVRTFKQILNNLLVSRDEAEEIVEEAQWAFDQHIKIFNQLG